MAFQYLKGLQEICKGTFCQGICHRPKGNSFSLIEVRFRLDIRAKFFTERVVRHWNIFPREVVDALSLEMSKAKLDEALSSGRCPFFPKAVKLELEDL